MSLPLKRLLQAVTSMSLLYIVQFTKGSSEGVSLKYSVDLLSSLDGKESDIGSQTYSSIFILNVMSTRNSRLENKVDSTLSEVDQM